MPKVKRYARPSSEAVADTLALLAVKLPRTLRALDAAPKLTVSESSALGVLVHAGAMNLGKLAEYEQVTPASISRTIKVLGQRGLVSRARDKADGRGSVVRSTVLGTRMFNEGHQRKLAPLIEWIDRLSSKDRAHLHNVLPILEAAALLEFPTQKTQSRPAGPRQRSARSDA